jgi:predicted GIY-YIG superfamily endonuclease
MLKVYSISLLFKALFEENALKRLIKHQKQALWVIY